VATTAKTSAQLWIPNGLQNLWATLICSGLLLLVFALVPLEAGARKRRLGYVLATALLTAIALVGCGGGSNGSNATGGSATGTPSGNYTIKVVGTSGSVSQTTSLKLTVQWRAPSSPYCG
jgi:apolipoprotein N-acyltransferase